MITFISSFLKFESSGNAEAEVEAEVIKINRFGSPAWDISLHFLLSLTIYNDGSVLRSVIKTAVIKI